MRERIAYGRLANPLPYALQNGYSRDLRPQEIPAIRLTNGRLEALVLPGLGGRLWSLRDLVADRDLVFTNRRLQFANFALTDAWFAGGIEWNLGSTGHSATTSRPVFAGSVSSSRGAALRIWEWERTRDLVFSVDLLMPADRPLLLAFVRVRNPDPEPKPLYWWTNIAAPEEPGVRVLAPATRAWRTAYDGSIASVDIPFADDPATDVSYPLSAQRAADYFFQVPSERRPWIAAVQADGRGLVQTSTAQLRGRKLFCWGTAAGGRHWQEWLCGPRSRYLEIQAGLATTQLEHLRLEGSAEISWAEAYAPIEAAPRAVHGSWPDALAEVAELVARAIPDEELDEWHRWWRAEVADAAPQQMTAGSGAGEAELVVRGEDPDGLPGTPFGQPLSDGFRHLVALARTGEVDQDAAGAEVLVPPITDRWEAVLDRAAEGWWGQLMIAIRSHARGDLEEARLGYLRSDQLRSTPWAARGLALLAGRTGRSRRRRGPLRPRRRPGADLPAAAGRGHRPTAGHGSTRRVPGDDRRRAGPDLLRTAGWSCSGHAPCWPTGKPTRPAPSSKPGSRCPIFGRGRRWGRCGAQRSATGRFPTTTTSGCDPTSSNELGMPAASRQSR